MAEEYMALTATLEQLAELDRYNHWIFDQIAHALGRRVIEIGSGTGNITQFLCAGGREVVATDVVPTYRSKLQKIFRGHPNVSVGKFDLTAPAPDEYLADPFDTVVCLNVLEHVDDDMFALGQMRDIMTDHASLALLVPAHQFLFGEFDRAVGHYRRYGRRDLSEKLDRSGFRIIEMKFFSMLATLPWLINGRLLKRDYLPAGQANLANQLVPLLKLERLIGPPFGLSLIAIAEKK